MFGVGEDTDTPKVEPVRIEANAKRGIGLRPRTVVNLAGSHEQQHAGVIKVEMSGTAEFDGKLGPTRSMLRVTEFVFPTGIVEEGEEAHDLLVSLMKTGKVQCIAPHRKPVRGTMDRIVPKFELGCHLLPESFF